MSPLILHALRCVRAPALILMFMTLATPSARGQSLETNVDVAIERAVARIKTTQQGNGTFRRFTGGAMSAEFELGYQALVVYTLLESGMSPEDPMIRRAVSWIVDQPFTRTYSAAMVVFALDELGDPAREADLFEAAQYLYDAFDARANSWGYPDHRPADLSNTQYAVLALDRATRHGFEIAPRFWAAVAEGVFDRRTRDGGYNYAGHILTESAGSMTAAGLAVLHIVARQLEVNSALDSTRGDVEKEIDDVWAWLDARFTESGNPARNAGWVRDRHPGLGLYGFWHYYTLYGIQRVAILADRERIGGVDWYHVIAVELLRRQSALGGWNSIENTCFALLTLGRASGHSRAKEKEIKALQPMSFAQATWSFTTDDPGEGWMEHDFDTRGWRRGAMGIGTADAVAFKRRTLWEEGDVLWARRAFKRIEFESDRLLVIHDDAAEVYIDGQLVGRRAGFSGYVPSEFELPASVHALRPRDEAVVAVRVHNTGGAGGMDVHPAPAPPEGAIGWWGKRSTANTTAIRQWLTLGPFAEKSATRLHESKIDEVSVAGGQGERVGGATWRVLESSQGVIDLSAIGRLKGGGVRYLFTWLHAEEDVEGVLWLGATDAVRAWVNGEAVVVRPMKVGGSAVEAFRTDMLPVELTLPAGVHGLLIKVEDVTGESKLSARLSSREGTSLPALRPSSSRAGFDEAAVRRHPELARAAELRAALPLGKGREEFTRADAIANVALGPAPDVADEWIGRASRKGTLRPPAGANGLAVIEPLTQGASRFMWCRLKRGGRATVEARVAIEVAEGCSAKVRLGQQRADDTVAWLAEVALASDGGKGTWETLRGDLAGDGEDDALVVLEVTSTSRNRVPVYVDSIRIDG